MNNNTASASEIVSCSSHNFFFCFVSTFLTKFPFQVATALHDNCRAVLVGERTYGKVLILFIESNWHFFL